jgi:hypothetical protein
MDKTLQDYIQRTTKAIEEKNFEPINKPKDNQYLVYPEDDGTDAKRNPYSPV